MNTQHAWRALFWKEWQEVRSFAWVLLMLPPVVNLVDNGRFHPEGLVRVGGNLIFLVVTALWAAGKGGAQRNPNEFALSHLPASPTLRWAISYALPLIGATVAGAWCGLWSIHPVRAVFGAFGGATTFALAYHLASVFSTRVGMFVGVLSAFTVGFALATSREFDVPGDLRTWLPFLGLGVSAIFGSVILGLAARRWDIRTRQAATVLLLVSGMALGIWNSTHWMSALSAGQRARNYPVRRLDSSDWSLYVSPEFPSGERFEMEFGDLRTGRTVKREFETSTVPVDFLGRDRVVLVRQTGRDRSEVQVLLWDTRLDRVTQKMSFDVGTGALLPVRGFVEGFVRPDGRYMLLALRSMAGQGRDLWVIDLARKKAMVACANAKFGSSQVRWLDDRAVLDGMGSVSMIGRVPSPALLVRLPGARASRIQAPEKDGG